MNINTSMSEVNVNIQLDFKETCQKLGSHHTASSLSPSVSPPQLKSKGGET